MLYIKFIIVMLIITVFILCYIFNKKPKQPELSLVNKEAFVFTQDMKLSDFEILEEKRDGKVGYYPIYNGEKMHIFVHSPYCLEHIYFFTKKQVEDWIKEQLDLTVTYTKIHKLPLKIVTPKFL